MTLHLAEAATALRVCTPTSGDPEFGSVELRADDQVVAGGRVALELVYTAGLFGIDDSGALRVTLRYASDLANPQFSEPGAANYVSAEASNGAVLELTFDARTGKRPFTRTLLIRVLRGFLRSGETITLRFGDVRFGSPGLRFQTAAEEKFQFRVAVDAMSAGVFREIAAPSISVVAGRAAKWCAVLPTICRPGARVSLGLRADDVWGNPALLEDAVYHLKWTPAHEGLPATLSIPRGRRACSTDFTAPSEFGLYRCEIHSAGGDRLAESNFMSVASSDQPLALWADMHGQSEETMGLNSADSYFGFAKYMSFLDVVGHQGIDFQMTDAFFARLNQLTAAFNQDDRFVTLPGYEWAGNTGLGGDRNVYYASEQGAVLYRSSTALIDEAPMPGTIARTASELFTKLRSGHPGTAIAFAHVGGRYADVKLAHDGVVEKSVEIHSTWGTFEWLLYDAFEAGHRVGVVCSSDDHKGRQGAAHPGSSDFGSYGGLTCIRAERRRRPEVFAALQARSHYGTTGARIHLEVNAVLPVEAEIFRDDPAVLPSTPTRASVAAMGSIVRTGATAFELEVDAIGTTPIERIEIRVGREIVHVHRPQQVPPTSRRFRLTWEGAEYRGRGRQSCWDGKMEVRGNRVLAANPIGFWNPEKQFNWNGEQISWQSTTTGNAAGADIVLEHSDQGEFEFRSKLANFTACINEVGAEPVEQLAGGLARKVCLQRLPEIMSKFCGTVRSRLEFDGMRDMPVWVCVVQEDGHRAWSSPIYFIG
jgi:hypothetical protein